MADWTLKPGREIIDADLFKLASLGATYRELAEHYQTSPTWLINNKKEIIDAGVASTKLKLRQAQIQIALDSTHPKQATMLIFLGKAMLGQRETTETIITQEDKNFAITFVEPDSNNKEDENNTE